MEKQTPILLRQGDVMIIDPSIPHFDGSPRVDLGDAKLLDPNGENVTLAYGEVTGHHHSLKANSHVSLYGHDELGPKRLDVERPSIVRHQEHAPIEIPAGRYHVEIQREYVPGELPRQVLD